MSRPASMGPASSEAEAATGSVAAHGPATVLGPSDTSEPASTRGPTKPGRAGPAARPRPKRRRVLRLAAATTGALTLGLIACAAALWAYVVLHPYPVEELHARTGDSLRIHDTQGRLLREVVNAEGERMRWRALEDISPLVVQATIAVEDARFHEHPGVDVRSVARAVAQALRYRRVVSGASTLTMQLARRLHPHPRTLRGKLGEMLVALRLERAVDKHTVLEQYLNRAPYGAGTVGVEAASQRYFGKPGTHLSLAEAALLAGLPQAPTSLNPFKDLERARVRQRTVLARMRATGAISEEEHARALAEPLRLAGRDAPPSTQADTALHFTDYVVSLRPPQGEVRTTLDGDLQRELESLVRGHVDALSAGGVTNAAVVVLDNTDCHILAMVGSARYGDAGAAGSVNGALARRQPGSALKPFTYALAFERGDTPASVVADVETRYGEADGDLFSPRNYSGDYSGPVLMGEALGRSLNVPAIRVARRVGLEPLLTRLRDVGFSSLDAPASHYGLGLTLGNGEVTLLELAQAYAMFARKGLTCRATPFAGPPAPGDAPHRAFSEEVAWLITDVLSDESLRMRGFGAGNALMLGFPVAVKTGTSTNWRDNWAVGYTPRFTVAVWTGDFSNRPLNGMTGATGAGPLFHKVMKRVVRRADPSAEPERTPPPEGIVEGQVCAHSGQLPTSSCPVRRRVRLPKEHAPDQPCPWHREVRLDARNGLLAGDRCPEEHVVKRAFAFLPAPYASWQATHGRESAPAAPTRYSPLCPEQGPVPGALVITWPRPGEVFLIEPGYSRSTQTLRLSAEVEPRLAAVTWLVDGRPVRQAPWPYDASWALQPGRHRLEVVARGLRSEPVDIEVR
ncbi:penicillin-binding protein 1C [Myxococcus sp. RHSTA-1-4]|uniref:penicillin-binding protein 1C n=1 Tax=Myxococcus sp. RHSTA-1-4 TaxID=2874601 RepID=UPI001CBA91E2|nr:penicillin-binding protein 1C [Myxococcus sp. RHSTA-1-4]MBZ4420570.1 penicillin-binding protein 1C [Myxococcus sp. RHSTA-1-4]